MEQNNSREFLESTFLNVLINGINTDNIESLTDLFKKYLNNGDEILKDFNINYLLLNLILLIKNNQQISPALFLYIQELEIKILRCTSESLTKNLTQESPSENNDIKDHEETEEEIVNRISKRLISKVYSPGSGEFRLPPKGEKGNLYIFEVDEESQLRYKANLELDSDGNVLDILEGPTLVNYNIKSYDEIYGGLLNDILMYSEESKYGE